ncbi:hypothetical protein BD779DRAFT_1492572 [Infundibulicybe gibba]|nr:hypothetical protein BD779DRAFT_1492572 [Infundibulicybe gibba]
MSRHPSPGPSHPQNITQNSQAPVLSRQKSKSYAIGIAAGAEDVKYQAKYKDLKKKVKEIEDDNDKLQFKVLQAKRSIQRMKLERAILYERLSAVPPSPDANDRHGLPPMHTAPSISSQVHSSRTLSGGHPHQEHREHSTVESDHNLVDYIRTHGNPRVAPGPDGRPIPVIDTPMGPGLRQLPPLPQLPSVQQLEGAARGHGHAHTTHTSPSMHHSHSSSSHEYSRSHSSSRSRVHHPPQPYHAGQPYSEGLPPVQHVLSPPLSERERSRRGDIHDYASSHGDPHAVHHQVQYSPHIYSEPRASSRPHNHQRIGPGTYLNRDEYHDRDRERQRDPEKERDHWERSRDHARGRETNSSHMHTPPSVHPFGAGGLPMPSRSDTPGSGSGSGGSGIGGGDGPSRPDSPKRDIDFVQEDGRSQSRDQGQHSRPSMGSRKRNRNDMDVDSENDVGEGPPGGGRPYSTGRLPDDRGSKRYHREHLHRGVDNQEDDRMGHP